ncbi:heterogeneous nuclear ribonucleoprotein U-like protein 2 [Tachyglossus aculeatus]|uniref:heterogeneous nuclear ribonucleoprotein U-like protein 2 n=1 Tax=Tachyglossus aculeatus TaxID=9261 RepID=UPI0018F74562|nr:heterogeneous nuclear ribonucleoprotein U-like protein 2 [Tachyglossus aculeatus]
MAAPAVKRLRVWELRRELQRRGLDSRGLRGDLARRLRDVLDAEMLQDEDPGTTAAQQQQHDDGEEEDEEALLGPEEGEEEEEEGDARAGRRRPLASPEGAAIAAPRNPVEDDDDEEEDEEALLGSEEEEEDGMVGVIPVEAQAGRRPLESPEGAAIAAPRKPVEDDEEDEEALLGSEEEEEGMVVVIPVEAQAGRRPLKSPEGAAIAAPRKPVEDDDDEEEDVEEEALLGPEEEEEGMVVTPVVTQAGRRPLKTPKGAAIAAPGKSVDDDDEEEDEEALLGSEEEEEGVGVVIPVEAQVGRRPLKSPKGAAIAALGKPEDKEEETSSTVAGARRVNGAEQGEPRPEEASSPGRQQHHRRHPGSEPTGENPGRQEDDDKEEVEQGNNQDSEKSKPTGPDGEQRGVKRQRDGKGDEKEEHGRAYYEFLEEAYQSRSKSPPPPEEETKDDEEDQTLVNLDTYTSDLHFQVSKDRYGGQPLFSEKFPTLWSGARSTYGVTKGKICFEAKVTQNLQLKEGCTETSLFRVGWSVDFSRPQLGEDELSFGYDGRGLKAENGRFEKFGQTFGEHDVIGCFASFESDEVELSFRKNGEDLGVAFRVSKDSLGARALLPHVLCKNCVVELNFGQKEEPFFPPAEGFAFIQAVPVEERVRAPLPPKTAEECEVLLMVGLPGTGKTRWALEHARGNPEKRYNVLGAETVLRQMRTRGPGEPELDSEGRDILVQQASQCLSKLVRIASRTKRNFILDQCNVYDSGQRRKLLPFRAFSRKAVVIVPDEEAWKKRLQLRKEVEGDDVPPAVMLEMKANFSVPQKCKYVEEVIFGELAREAAQPLVTKYRAEARKLLPPTEEKRTDRPNKPNRHNRPRGQGYAGGQHRGHASRAYGQQSWGQPGNRGGHHNFYNRYQGDYDRFCGRDCDYNRSRDYYGQYNRQQWQNYYQDRDRYYRNYYGYRAYR